MAVSTPLLDTIQSPADLRKMPQSTLVQVAEELRLETIDAAATSGGHFGAGLGVIEMTVALHYVFDTPEDRVIWDVSHQTYPHKILTGRRDRIRQIRQRDGLYGFAKRDESNFDNFGAAHSSTSISAGLGMAASANLHPPLARSLCSLRWASGTACIRPNSSIARLALTARPRPWSWNSEPWPMTSMSTRPLNDLGQPKPSAPRPIRTHTTRCVNS